MRQPTAIVCAALVSLAASLAVAQEAVIREIQVRNAGAGRVDESYILTHIGSKTGAKLNQPLVAKDVRTLLAENRFTDVRAEVESLDNGVRLIFSIRNKLKLAAPIEIEGAKAFKASKIRNLLGLEPGSLVDDQVLGVHAVKVRDEYRKDYFPDAALSWKIEETDHAEGLARVTATVKEGSRTRVAQVIFAGNKVLSSGALRRTVDQPSRWNPLWWFRMPGYDADKFRESQEKIRGLYLDRGYADVEVDPPVVEPDARGNMTIRITIREGALYRFGSLSIGGASLFPEASLAPLIAAKTGDVASLSAREMSAQALRDYYGNRGYVNTTVTPALDPDRSKQTMNVRFVVAEGTLKKIRNILIRGNTCTRDKVIRRELLVYPGDVYNEVLIRRSQRIVYNLGYFADVRSYPESTTVQDSDDLVFEVEEQRTGSMMLGGGFSSLDNLFGQFQIRKSNFDLTGWPYFSGGGQSLDLTMLLSSKRREFEVAFVEPWFMDRKLSLSVELFRSANYYSDYDLKRTGGAIGIGKPLPGANNRIDFRYRIEGVEMSNIADTNEYYFADSPQEHYFFSGEQKKRTESTFTVSLTHDSRNNPFFPSRGDRVSLFGSVSGGLLGFDSDIYRVGLRAVHYVPLWFRHVLSLQTRWEVVDKYGDMESIPIGNRLFIGGGNSIRGFDYRNVGPKVKPVNATADSAAYRPVGGSSLAMASAEYTIPLVQSIRFAAFYDTGNVWREPYDFDVRKLASSAGIGFRLDVPGFPISIDRAWVIEKDDHLTRTEAWVFWIGRNL